MAMRVTESPGIREIPSFTSVDAAVVALEQKAQHDPTADLYPRDGDSELFGLETRMSDLVGIEEGHLLLYGSGMLALQDALRSVRPIFRTTVFFGNQQYSQCNAFITGDLKEDGARVIGMDLSSPSQVAKTLDTNIGTNTNDVIVIETVSNGPDMQVPDLEAILSHPKVRDTNPWIIFDNTVPSPIGLTAAKFLDDPTRRIAIVESGTKFYGLNQVQGLSGMTYTKNEEFLAKLKTQRQRVGSRLHPSAVRDMSQIILPTKEEFEERTRTILSNTGKLAAACAGANGNGEKFYVTYPHLSDHPNYDYTTRQFPHGAAPVFFIQAIDPRYDQFYLTRALWENALEPIRRGIRTFCKLGQSFGFDHTRIWPDAKYPALRIAGGRETSEEMAILTKSFAQALSSI